MAKTPAVRNPEWTEADSAKVQAIRKELQVTHPDISAHTLHEWARKSYFKLTGQVYSHGLSGFDAGCKCYTCSTARQHWNARRTYGAR